MPKVAQQMLGAQTGLFVGDIGKGGLETIGDLQVILGNKQERTLHPENHVSDPQAADVTA